jgi:hypothetical protein
MTSRTPVPLSPTSPTAPTLDQLTMQKSTTPRKKVRFREFDEVYESGYAVCDRHARDDGAACPSPQLRQKLTSGEAGAVAPRSNVVMRAQKQSGPSLSYVPEHVRRPEAFTCYELDVPIVVGSGIDGTEDPLTSVNAAAAGPSAHKRGTAGVLRQGGSSRPAMPSSAGCSLQGAGLPQAEYLQAGEAAPGCGVQGDAGLAAGSGVEGPGAVDFVPRKGAKVAVGNSQRRMTSDSIAGVLSTPGDVGRVCAGAAGGARPEARDCNACTTAHGPQGGPGPLSFAGEAELRAEDAMDVECGSRGMLLDSGSLSYLEAGGSDAMQGVEAAPLPAQAPLAGPTFDFPIGAATVSGVGVFGSGVAKVAPASEVHFRGIASERVRHTRGRRSADED